MPILSFALSRVRIEKFIEGRLAQRSGFESYRYADEARKLHVISNLRYRRYALVNLSMMCLGPF